MNVTNFAFLETYQPQLMEQAELAEKLLYVDAGSCLTRLRGFAEEMVRIIYNEEHLPRLPQASFNDLLQSIEFRRSVAPELYLQLDYLRLQGNKTAHGAKGDVMVAKEALKVAHKLAIYMMVRYAYARPDQLTAYQEPLSVVANVNESKRIKELEERLQAVIQQLEAERIAQAKQAEMLSDEDLDLRKQQSTQVAQSLGWDEAATRRYLIDAQIAQAGWEVNNPQEVEKEHKLTNFKGTPSGRGAVDYVFWGDDGKPLAVLEAKKTSRSVQDGREQVCLYADALEETYGQRPVLFYSNGYQLFIWDDAVYNTPRQLFNFYDKESLQKLFFQRQYKQDLTQNYPNRCQNIAGRMYQTAAIKAVAESFQNQRRSALIVQATGTGKTRVAIALIHLLLEKKWAKRVLFLCDRRELRRQADEAFKDFLPSEPRCLVGETGEIDNAARVYVSTYPAMMNRFAQLNTGYFDVIVADESHRSIYNKYGDIFDYFDALRVGLTATPVSFISRNTYSLFGCENQMPTYSFDLEEAWAHEPPYLARYVVKEMTTEFLREGIRYDQLSAEQKRQLEEDLGEEEAQNADFEAAQLGKDIFSYATDSAIITNLMEKGLRAKYGRLGKTIIFAQSQKHAEHLEKIFCQLYPQYGTAMCKVIHHGIQHVDHLIGEFKQPDNAFRIAVSVDMLDTGIDVPEILNLVFAKAVRSKVKFWQMIGRGTRLCQSLLDQNADKDHFVIFDHYQNFEYFGEKYQEREDVEQAKPLYQSCFDARLAFAKEAKKQGRYFEWVSELIKQDVLALPLEAIAVKRELETVTIMRESNAISQWDNQSVHRLEKIISPLMGQRPLPENEIQAVRFDRLIAQIQGKWLTKTSDFGAYQNQLLDWLGALADLDVVRKHQATIDRLRHGDFWAKENIEALEQARLELRGIMQYRRYDSVISPIYVNTTKVADGKIEIKERIIDAPRYSIKMKLIFEQFADNIVIQKVKHNQVVSKDEIESLFSLILVQHPNVDLASLKAFYGETVEDLNRLLKEIVGLDAKALEKHFEKFTQNHRDLTAKQVQFLDLLQSFLARHGGITREKLFDAPFTIISHEGIDGLFDPQSADELFDLIEPYFVDKQGGVQSE